MKYWWVDQTRTYDHEEEPEELGRIRKKIAKPELT